MHDVLTCALKATSVVAAAVFVGSEFQSRIVRGKKEYFLSDP
jgi:hypothetical protein